MSIKKLVLVPINKTGRSVKALATELSRLLGFKVFRVTPERIRRRLPFYLGAGTDKLTQFQRFESANVPIPEFTCNIDVARSWLPDGSIVCRTLLRSSEGKGIVIADTADQVVAAPLYTKYFKKKKEFRVHVFDGQVIDVQEKRKKRDILERDTRIRNVHNGYVFCREGLMEPQQLRDIAIRAVSALGYRFGAVDIAYNEHRDECVVFEVNSNPGLQGSTLQTYTNAIANWYKEQVNAV